MSPETQGQDKYFVWRVGSSKSLSTCNGAFPPSFRTAYNVTSAGDAKMKAPRPHSISMVEILLIKIKVTGLRQATSPREETLPCSMDTHPSGRKGREGIGS